MEQKKKTRQTTLDEFGLKTKQVCSMVNPYAQIKKMSKSIRKYKRLLKQRTLSVKQKKLLHRVIGDYYFEAPEDERETFDQIMYKLGLDDVE